MSEIYAPGSLAGPQGPAGPAGSAAAVSALAAAIMPSFVGANLFDATKVTPGNQVNAADGTLSSGAPSDASALIYCPGATSMVSNMAINATLWGGGVCLYDANGIFLSALPSTAFSSLISGGATAQGAAFTLPGTQTYVRLCHVTSWDGPWGVTNASGMIYAAISGTATLPGSYQPCGVDTVADVNAKDAVVAANAAAALTSAVTNIGRGLGLFAHTLLPLPDGGARNGLDIQRVLHNTAISNAGAQVAAPGWSSAMVFAPGATQFISNLPIRGNVAGVGGTPLGICTYDAFGNFLADVSGPLQAAGAGGGLILPNSVCALPGNQAYVGFSWNPGNYGWGPEPNGTYFAPSDAAAMFIVGNATTPCPSSLPQGVPACGSRYANVKTATELGAANDASVDCAALLNAFLATASATNPIKLILDGRFALSTSLVLSPGGCTTIEGIGYGSSLSVTGGAANAIITSGDSAGRGAYNVPPPARTAANIILRDFSAGGVDLVNCSNVLVDNLYFLASPNFALTISNANNVVVTRSTFCSSGTIHDGCHVDGKCEDILISDCYFATGDDAIALNAPEGCGGDISRVTVTNCIFDHSLTVMRIYTSLDAAAMPSNNVHKVRNVVVSNCTGTVTSYCFDLGITNGGLSPTADVDQLQDFSVSNCTLSAPSCFAWIGTPCGSIAFRAIKFIPTSAAAVVWLWSPAGELVLDDFTILRNGDGNAAPAGFISNLGGGSIDRLSLLNCRVVDEEGSSYAAIPYLLDAEGSVAALRLETVDMTHIAALTSSAGWTNVALLRGDGVIGTGMQVPDSVMDANVLYLSSNAGGAASIKIGGTARRLTLA